MNDHGLEIRGLSIEFRTRHRIVNALRGIDLDVPAGRIVGLVGESGSGKSVTALAVLGLLHAQARVLGGSIRFAGTDLVPLAERELQRLRGRRISLVPQDPLTALNPGLRIGAQLEAVLRSHGGRGRGLESTAVELLEQAHLASPRTLLDRYPRELSGGQRQRVVIALALAGGPELLIADEATTALDVTTQLAILTLLRERNQATALSLLVISHDLTVVAEICEDVYVMHAGEIVEHGPVEQILIQPRHGYTRALIAALPDPDRRGTPLGTPAVDEADAHA